MCLATTAYVYALLCIRVTIFSNGSIIPTGFKLTELHTLTLAAHSYRHTYIPTYMHAYMHTYLPTYIHTYIHTEIHLKNDVVVLPTSPSAYIVNLRKNPAVHAVSG